MYGFVLEAQTIRCHCTFREIIYLHTLLIQGLGDSFFHSLNVCCSDFDSSWPLLQDKGPAYPWCSFKQGRSFHIHKTYKWENEEPEKQLSLSLTLSGDSVWMWWSVCDGSGMDRQSNSGIVFPSSGYNHQSNTVLGSINWTEKTSYRAHYRGILSSSSPAEISAWGSSASERTSSPGSDTASAKTLISVQSKTQSSRIINNTISRLCICQTVHIHVTWDTYFDKIFHFKRQLPAHIENLHALSQDFYFSCWHPLLVSTDTTEKEDGAQMELQV